MAKAKFVFANLLALNEIGGDPDTVNLNLVQHIRKENNSAKKEFDIVFVYNKDQSSYWVFKDELLRDKKWEELINS